MLLKIFSLRKTFFPASLVLIGICLLVRAATLEQLDLTDPTESRYALVAAEMMTTGDWLTPRIITDEGHIPYLGKPPLHFWLTAASYKVFGMNEWVSRLPSFISLVGIALLCLPFSRQKLSARHPELGSLIAVSSGLLFFLAGASVIDVSFTFFVTATFVSFALAEGRENLLPCSPQDLRRQRIWGYAFFGFHGLAFLTKGPLTLVLGGLTIAVWTLITGDYRRLLKLPWLGGISLFLLLVAPWFYLQERTNPGFLRYFFVNENFLRFISRKYGDLYGSGHTHYRGAALWMLFLAFLPWSAVLAALLWMKRKNLSGSGVRAEPWLSYLVCWSLVPALFFAFARQLHAGYILPCIPPLALLTAALLERLPAESKVLSVLKSFSSIRAIFVAGAGIILAGILSGGTLASAFFACAVLPASWLILRPFRIGQEDRCLAPKLVSAGVIVLYTIVIVVFSGIIDATRSVERILEHVSREAKGDRPAVTVVGKHSFSASWLALAWPEELYRPVTVSVRPFSQIKELNTDNVIIRQRDLKKLPDSIPGYELIVQSGAWAWLQKK